MAFEVPSRDAILAFRTARELFGDAVAKPRELKRAYAALIRAYRAEDDPEVFQHVRALYEQARSAPDEAEPLAEPPAERLARALRERDPQRALDLLSHTPALVAEAPELVADALRLLVFGAGPLLSGTALDVVEVALGRPEVPLHPDEAEELIGDVIRLHALHDAAEDPELPEPLLVALRAGWRRSAPVVARAWLEAARALDTSAIDVAISRLELRHPAVLGLWNRQALRLRVGAPPRLPEEEVLSLGRQMPPTVHIDELAYGPLLDLLMSRGGLFLLFAVGIGIGQALGLGLVPTLMVGVAVRFGVWSVVQRQLLPGDAVEAFETLHSGYTAPLVALARAHGAWPEEVVLAVAPPAPVPLYESHFAYAPGHPLLVLRQDPGATLKVLTEAHVERVERAAEAARG